MFLSLISVASEIVEYGWEAGGGAKLVSTSILRSQHIRNLYIKKYWGPCQPSPVPALMNIYASIHRIVYRR